MKLRLAIPAAGVLAGVVVCNAALAADESSSLTVSQKPQIRKNLVEHSSSGYEVFNVTAKSNVSLRDLDLSTKAGYDEAVRRIKLAAKNSCEEIASQYPLENVSVQDCAKETLDKAMVRVDALASSPRGTTVGSSN